jgi:Cu(I)/Ag(I) efflux system membrane fusion protein
MKRFGYAWFSILIAVAPFLSGPLYGGEEAGHDQSLTAEENVSSLPPGSVLINTERQQLIGIKTVLTEKKTVTHTIRVLGRVSADDTRIYRIVASVDGWIKDARSNSVGSLVKKDEVLATFYNSQFLDAEQSYLFALGTVDRLELGRKQLELGRKEAPVPPAFDPYTVQRQIDVLRGMGVADPQIEEIGRTRKISLDIRIVSPVEGFVIARNVSPEQRFLKGTELYQIADLRRVWILADVYDQEVESFRPGMKARVTLPYKKKTYEATVTEILPVFDASTRTLKIRLETDNPGYVLRSDMFVDVEIPVTYPDAIMVPVEAILDSGLKKTVFVDLGKGSFEPREVKTARYVGDQVEIVEGIDEGERIVVSGNFLLDSESKLEMAAWGKQTGLSKDPVNNLDVSERKAARQGRTVVYKGKTYYFSSDACKAQFEKEPEKYVGKE